MFHCDNIATYRPRRYLARQLPFIQPNMMAGNSYNGGGTTGGKWGCALAAIVRVSLVCFALLISTLGDCIPEEPCNRYLQWPLILGALAIASTAGIASRAIINWVVERRWNDD